MYECFYLHACRCTMCVPEEHAESPGTVVRVVESSWLGVEPSFSLELLPLHLPSEPSLQPLRVKVIGENYKVILQCTHEF